MDFTRQLDILNPTKQLHWPVHLIGLGGIGSAVARPLVMLGISELHLYDDDVVSEENPSNQFYYPDQVGQKKVLAMAKELGRYPGVQIVPHDRRITADDRLEGIVISGVDSMASRYAIWEGIKPHPDTRQFNTDVVLYLDGRLGGEDLRLLVIRPANIDDVELYEKCLFPDSEAAPLPCTAKAIIDPAVALAAEIVARIKNWVRGESYRVTHRRSMQTERTDNGRQSA
jgi:molybdopterin/thiamine biosynthesis adenylyltransferase